MDAWTAIECELIVADYFKMLSLELAGKSFNKAEHRRQLQPLLNNRSGGSIEFKHQNISAVLIRLGRPYIKGYLPRYNAQSLLAEKVIEYLSEHPILEIQFKQFAENTSFKRPEKIDFEKWLVTPPAKTELILTNVLNEPEQLYVSKSLKKNYLEQEQKNAHLGKLGEELVLDYERWQLKHLGFDQLAKQVTWVAQDDDSAGFDILSRNVDGSHKFIEVKTTRLGKETPFFFSKGELQFSQLSAEDYHLYRVFDATSNAKIFMKNGSLDQLCHSEPVQFRGWF